MKKEQELKATSAYFPMKSCITKVKKREDVHIINCPNCTYFNEFYCMILVG